MNTTSWILSCVALLSAAVAGLATESTASKPIEVTGDDGVLKVWSGRDNRFIDEETFIDAVARQRLVVLGEVHDNPLHHRLRAEIVAKINAHRANRAPQAPPPAAVFEHATTDRQTQFDALSARYSETGANTKTSSGTGAQIASFFKAADWKVRGWPKSEIFAPLIGAVLSAKMPLYAGDVPRQRMMRVARGSSTSKSEALSGPEIERLKLDQSLGDANNQAALTEIAESHCGVLPKSMLGPMAYAQRLRDATLADVLLKASVKHGSAILFAGNGHVRNDRAVPWYVRARTGQQVVAIMFKEHKLQIKNSGGSTSDVTAEAGEGQSASAQQGSHLAADYVIWTAERERPDPCRKLREKYGKTKR